MLSTFKAIVGFLAAMLALMMFGLSLFAASATQHTLREDARERLETAVKFVRDQEAKTGVVPESVTFDNWAREMDLKGYRFDGHGFALDKRCGSNASEFCISFSTGDGFVTYKSWQRSTDKVTPDDSPLPWALGFLLVGLVSGMLSWNLVGFHRKVLSQIGR